MESTGCTVNFQRGRSQSHTEFASNPSVRVKRCVTKRESDGEQQMEGWIPSAALSMKTRSLSLTDSHSLLYIFLSFTLIYTKEKERFRRSREIGMVCGVKYDTASHRQT